jgi:hypothetical protein
MAATTVCKVFSLSLPMTCFFIVVAADDIYNVDLLYVLTKGQVQTLLNNLFTQCPFHNHKPERTITGKNTHLTASDA